MKITDEGILIEEKNFLLRWGEPVEKLANHYGAVVEKRKDIYAAYWGEDSFIKGSGINLFTLFHPGSTFEKVEYYLDSRRQSIEKYDLIKNYFIELIKEYPESIILKSNDSEFNLQLRGILIRLSIEDFHGLKVYLEIERKSSN
jgi:hypothetical protein